MQFIANIFKNFKIANTKLFPKNRLKEIKGMK